MQLTAGPSIKIQCSTNLELTITELHTPKFTHKEHSIYGEGDPTDMQREYYVKLNGMKD